jgi:hypothetical protein
MKAIDELTTGGVDQSLERMAEEEKQSKCF